MIHSGSIHKSNIFTKSNFEVLLRNRTKYDFFLTPELLVISSAKTTVMNWLKLTYTTCILNPSIITSASLHSDIKYEHTVSPRL